MLNQNPPQFTCDCTTQLTQVPKYRHDSPKRIIVRIFKTRLISSKTTFNHSSKFYSPTSSISTYFDIVSPKLSRGPGVGQLQSVYILSRFIIRLGILPTNFQLALTSTSWTNSLSLFLELVYYTTWYTTHQLPVGHDVIQLGSRSFNCIQRYSPTKLSYTFIFSLW